MSVPISGPTHSLGSKLLRAIGPSGMSGMPTGTGPLGIGPQGATGPIGHTLPPRFVQYPSSEGKLVTQYTCKTDVVEIRVAAASQVGHQLLRIDSMINMTLLRNANEFLMKTWSNGLIYQLSPEDMANESMPLFTSHELSIPSQCELIAMFVMAKKAIMKMMAVVCAELLIDHISLDEMSEAWQDAIALRVMTE